MRTPRETRGLQGGGITAENVEIAEEILTLDLCVLHGEQFLVSLVPRLSLGTLMGRLCLRFWTYWKG